MVSKKSGKSLVYVQNALLQQSPPGPRPLDAIHVNDIWNAMDTLPKVINTCIVPKGQTDIPELTGMRNAQPVKFRCAPPAGKIDRYGYALDAVPHVFHDRTSSLTLAIYDDPPTVSYEVEGYILRCCFETSIICRNTMRSQYSNSLFAMMIQSYGLLGGIDGSIQLTDKTYLMVSRRRRIGFSIKFCPFVG